MKNKLEFQEVILTITLIQSCKKETDDVIKDIDGNSIIQLLLVHRLDDRQTKGYEVP